ncbi:hypothetical protein DFA_07514 [Cavenderia fasciculata]|uniref:Oxidation resistance protein 1 n=1 Tax=Cavenderia fasciculata TaxID=261658 RepID=F4PWM6_CACFS|nr:uncharacterized protein DFA_07514 [Cavenderia fasciculata]EGG20390.1 hypothetical protein DFA_07514 [Cavenderia fasciculata]|eukprot:XP_004367373.1 hypothetical protein DFA_07514 [Cavenderia fasciculata]
MVSLEMEHILDIYYLNYLRDGDDSIFPSTYKKEIMREMAFYRLCKSPSNLIDFPCIAMITDWIGSYRSYKMIHKCDDQGETVTLIKSADGNVFGGYISQSWNSTNTFYGDSKCFLFTIINKQGLNPANGGTKKPIWGHKDLLTSFGAQDIYLRPIHE